MKKKPLPLWLRAYFQIALLGSIDTSVRMIVISLSDDRELLVRFYLDSEASDDIKEDIEVLQVEVDAMTSKAEALESSESEIIVTQLPLKELDTLDGVIYARKER